MSLESKKEKTSCKTISQKILEERMEKLAAKIQKQVEIIEGLKYHPQGWNPSFHDPRACVSGHNH